VKRCEVFIQDGEGGGEECGGRRVCVYINNNTNAIGTWCKDCHDIELYDDFS
jgi:hypothetical protein